MRPGSALLMSDICRIMSEATGKRHLVLQGQMLALSEKDQLDAGHGRHQDPDLDLDLLIELGPNH